MSLQKCMSYLKCSNLEAEKIIDFTLCYQINKRSSYNFRYAKSRKRSFSDGFYASENQINKKIQTEKKTH